MEPAVQQLTLHAPNKRLLHNLGDGVLVEEPGGVKPAEHR